VTAEEAIEAAELVEAETAYRRKLAREMTGHAAAAAYESGYSDGYTRAIADVKAAQHGIVRDVELETRRWGPGGRARFADPCPGDFRGRVPEPRQPEPEPEMEIH
jgi:hypothetical protein